MMIFYPSDAVSVRMNHYSIGKRLYQPLVPRSMSCFAATTGWRDPKFLSCITMFLMTPVR